MIVLRALDVRKVYAGRPGEPDLEILRGLSLDVSAGETIAVMGRSGCGKSTFLSLLAGLDRPTSGRVEINGRSWGEVPPRELNAYRAKTMGIVFQQFHLLDHLTALENARLPLDLATGGGRPQANGDARARELLERVGLGARLRHFPGQMSRGEQQRCAIARTLAMDPSIVLADEPTGSLDARTGREVIDLLFQLAAEKRAALVLVTHDPALAARCARCVYLEDGSLSAARPEGFG